MLKRNGEFCKNEIPGYAGRLTDSELAAYNAAFPPSRKFVGELITSGNRVTEIEKSVPRYGDLGINAQSKYQMATNDNREWRVIESLFKVAGVEFLFCKRDVAGRSRFAVVEKLDAANIHDAEVSSEGDDVREVLQRFLKDIRGTLRLWADDVERQASEKLEKEFPGHDTSRVAKAISQRCAAVVSGESQAMQVQTQNRGAKIGM